MLQCSSPEVRNDIAGTSDHATDRDELVDVRRVEISDDLCVHQVVRLCLQQISRALNLVFLLNVPFACI